MTNDKSMNKARNESLFYFIIFIQLCSAHFAYFFLPLFLLETGLNGWQSGFLFSIFTVTGIIFSLFFGILTDKVNPKKLIFSALILYFLFFTGLRNGRSFYPLMFAFLMGGIAYNLFSTSTESSILKLIGGIDRGVKLGLLSLVRSMPIALGVLIGCFLITKLDFKPIFRLSSFLSLSLLLPCLFLRDIEPSRFSLKVYSKDFFRKEVILFALIIFLFTLHWGAEITSYSPFLKQHFHLTKLGIGLFMAPPLLLLSISSFFFGKLMDRGMNEKTLLYLSLALSGTGIIFMALSKSVLLSISFRFMHETGDAAFTIFRYVGITNFFAAHRIGGNAGAIALVAMMGVLIGSLIFSPIGYSFGYAWPHIISGILTLLSLMGMIVFFGSPSLK